MHPSTSVRPRLERRLHLHGFWVDALLAFDANRAATVMNGIPPVKVLPVPMSDTAARKVAVTLPIEAAAPVPVDDVAPAVPLVNPLADLMNAHVLRDGEIVLMVLKPSLWFVLLNGLRFIAVVLIGMTLAKVFNRPLPGTTRAYLELGVLLIVARLSWAAMQWVGRLYVLTDRRVLTISGVYRMDVFDCPLRKVARTRVYQVFRDRLVRVGTIEILPQDETTPAGLWQTVARPIEVRERLVAAIDRAKTCGLG